MPVEMRGETVATAVLAPDDRHVLIATPEGRLWWIGLGSQERRAVLEFAAGTGVSAGAFSPDGKQFAAATTRGSVYLGNPSRGPAVEFACDSTSQISELRFSQDGRRLLCASQDGSLRIWDVSTGQMLSKWQAHAEPAMAAAFLTDGRIISAGLDDTIRIWDSNSAREAWRGEFGLLGIQALAVSPDGNLAAWGGREHRIVVWDLVNARKKYELQVPASMVCDVQFSPDNRLLAIGAYAETIYVFEAQTGAVSNKIPVAENF